MNTRTIIISCLFMAGIAAKAGNLPQGRWTVETVSVEKNTDGKAETTVYNSAAEVQSFIPCPQQWEINEGNIVVRYPNGREDTIEYTFIDDLLTVGLYDGIPYTFHCSISGEKLILTTSNSPAYIDKKWIITLVKID